MAAESRRDALTLLRTIPHFDDIAEHVLESVARHCSLEHLERGDRLWREGEEMSKVVFVLKGESKLLKYRGEEKQVIVDLLHAGDIAGARAIFEEAFFSTSAVALDDVEVLHAARTHIAEPAKHEPDLMRAMWRHALGRHYGLIRRLHELSVDGTETRLALVLDHLAYVCGIRKPRDDGRTEVAIPVPLSRADIAQMINTRVETAIRRMSEWRKEGIVETMDEGLLIRDPDRLHEIAGPAAEHADVPTAL